MAMETTEHRCYTMPADGVYVALAADILPDSEWRWCLYIERTATEQDLEESAYLEAEGDTLWCAAVGISHCPYCGGALPGASLPTQREAAITKTDYCFNWYGRES
ncbi:hypothetical protein [Halomonas sp. LBP4]|uniref:hypothetical protein n=1 Tax=Halomonas sp. LBP4 TaxID=2044917 RepID=UPI000D75CB57|nr:hypothetical protein [Halomonas sp. LBP4]PXX98303.1 hypothetical protein CR157_08250 [Halomonas sp. LBP4]